MTIAHFDSDDDGGIDMTETDDERTPLEKFKFVYDALVARKKIKFKHVKRLLSDGKMSPIVCIMANDHFDKVYAILADNAVVDYNFNLTDFACNDFEIYDEDVDINDGSRCEIHERTPLEKFKLVYDALSSHKKIKFKHKRNFISDDDTKFSPIVCIFTNPQFNRTFAILENRAVVDYKFELTDFGYNDFEIYDDTEEDFKEMTIEEIQLQLGFKIKIIG